MMRYYSNTYFKTKAFFRTHEFFISYVFFFCENKLTIHVKFQYDSYKIHAFQRGAKQTYITVCQATSIPPPRTINLSSASIPPSIRQSLYYGPGRYRPPLQV